MAVISAPLGAVSPSYNLGRGAWREFDWWMLLLVVTLSVWGCFTVASATGSGPATPVAASVAPGRGLPALGVARRGAARAGRLSDTTKQTIWIALGLTLLGAMAVSNYQWLMHLQLGLYLGTMALLCVLHVPHIAREVNGARSWIPIGPFSLEPAEVAKFAMIIALAGFLCRRQERIKELPTLFWSLLYLAPPLILILKQPDFGTTMAILSIWFGMMFFGGARLSHLGLVVLAGALLFGAAWKTNRLKPHQKMRLAVFLDRNPSPKAMKEGGYQIKQSQIAIGSGQLTGQGWGQGMQNRAGYVPENTTDFVFTVVAEELGFIGSAALLLIYLLLLCRCATTAMSTDNYFGVLIAGGFTALLAFHTIVNLGMTMRVMPITGVPLPFFSYGGSSYLTFSLSVGLLQSIATHRRRVLAL